jgi:hypothetical protein
MRQDYRQRWHARYAPLIPAVYALIAVLAGYGSLIRAYVAFILSKLRFHRTHPEFNGMFDYEEYVSLKNIDDPNEGYVPTRLVPTRLIW